MSQDVPETDKYPLNNSIHGILHCRKTKRGFVLLPDSTACAVESGSALSYRGHAPQESPDLIRASFKMVLTEPAHKLDKLDIFLYDPAKIIVGWVDGWSN